MSRKPTPRKPSAATPARMDAFSVRNYEVAGETKAEWTKVGVAFPHADSQGFNVVLQALPVDGKLVLRTYEPKAVADE